jgi:hypothetical protein
MDLVSKLLQGMMAILNLQEKESNDQPIRIIKTEIIQTVELRDGTKARYVTTIETHQQQKGALIHQSQTNYNNRLEEQEEMQIQSNKIANPRSSNGSPHDSPNETSSTSHNQEAVATKPVTTEKETQTMNQEEPAEPTETACSTCPICPICFNPPDTALVTFCGHVFCKDCACRIFRRQKHCPVCRREHAGLFKIHW